MSEPVGGPPPPQPQEPEQPKTKSASDSTDDDGGPTKTILGMQMTSKQAKMFTDQLIKSITDELNHYADRALQALKKLGRSERDED